MGPSTSARFCCVKCFTRHLMRVLLPTYTGEHDGDSQRQQRVFFHPWHSKDTQQMHDN